MGFQTKCLPLDDPNNRWTYCPSIGAAIPFAILFAITTSVHIFQAARYKKTFCWTLIMGAIWETTSFVIRTISIQHPSAEGIYDLHFILFLLAPLWINAFVYMLLGRMVYYYIPDKKLFRIRAERMALIFVLLDIVSFIIQIGGGLLTVSDNFDTLQTGLHLYTAGVALQEFFIFTFLYLVFTFQRRLKAECTRERKVEARRLLWVIYITLFLISLRILFRIIEFSAGAGTKLTQEFRSHEVYQYVLDAMLMFLALVALNILHPGKVLVGPESEFPKKQKKSRKQKKSEKEDAVLEMSSGSGVAV